MLDGAGVCDCTADAAPTEDTPTAADNDDTDTAGLSAGDSAAALEGT
jgi:hypothetical protein